MACSIDLKKTDQSTITLCYDKESRLKRVLKTRRQSHKFPDSNELTIAHTLSSNPHKNVARFFNGTRTRKGFKLAMRFYENGDLLEFQQGNSLSKQLSHRFFRDIVNGLAHLHSIGIAHRDISLKNIYLDNNLHCHIAGFSLASEYGTHCTGVIDTAFYTAPEVLREPHDNYDGFKSDIWSLGILLFILVSGGTVAFVRASDRDKNFQRFRAIGAKKYLEAKRLGLTEDCVDLLEKLLQVDPNERPSIEQVVNHPFLELALREKTSQKPVEKPTSLLRSIVLKFKRR